MFMYYTLRTSFLATYCYTWWLSIKLFLLPLINMYGGWNFLGMWLAICALSFITSYAFFSTRKPS